MINRGKMSNLGSLLICMFGDYLLPLLVAVLKFNTLDLDLDKTDECQGYEED